MRSRTLPRSFRTRLNKKLHRYLLPMFAMSHVTDLSHIRFGDQSDEGSLISVPLPHSALNICVFVPTQFGLNCFLLFEVQVAPVHSHLRSRRLPLRTVFQKADQHPLPGAVENHTAASVSLLGPIIHPFVYTFHNQINNFSESSGPVSSLVQIKTSDCFSPANST